MTSLFKMEVGSFHALVGVLDKAGLTAELAEKVRHNPEMAKRMVTALRVPDEGHPYRGGQSNGESAEVVEHFTPLADTKVPAEHQAKLAKYRRLVAEHNVASDVPLCYKARTGFTLKKHAPLTGPCYKNFQYLQDWNFEDKPTKDCLIFWVPRLVKGSTSKTVDEQRELLFKLRQRLGLPEHHLSGFGEASVLAGLILAHYKATGERIPLDGLYTRTDTCRADGHRLDLGWFVGYGLHCDDWYWVGGRLANLGVFALGVELGS